MKRSLFFWHALVGTGFCLSMSGCPRQSRLDCFGLRAHSPFEVHVVDAAASPGFYAPPGALLDTLVYTDLPSCEAFDGIDVNTIPSVTDVDLISDPSSRWCSLVRASAILPTSETVLGIRTYGRFEDELWGTPTAYFSIVAHGVVVSGCAGDWVLAFDIWPLIERHGDYVQKVWTEDQLFDMGTPGGQAPVLIARSFQPAEGSSCAALPQPTSRCQDVFLGYFAPKAP